MMIHIETIPHETQRYETCGDWYWETVEGHWNAQIVNQEILHVRVSSLGDWRHEACVALHEVVEALLCKDRGIAQADVDAFDKSKEGQRADEPGDHPKAPYRREHRAATAIEAMLLDQFDLDVVAYDAAIDAL